MKAHLIGACRGDGRAYLELFLDNSLVENSVKVQAFFGSANEIPCEWRVWTGRSRKAGTAVVARTPLWEQGKIRIEITGASRSGLETAFFELDGASLRVLSRATYLLRKQYAFELREFADGHDDGRLKIVLEDAIESDSELYVRGSVAVFSEESFSCVFKCLDAMGAAAPCSSTVLGVDRCTANDPTSRPTVNVRFSLYIPAGIESFTLVAADSEGRFESGFYSVLPTVKKQLLENGSRKVIDASKDSYYPLWLQSVRAMRQSGDVQSPIECRVIIDASRAPSNEVVRTLNSLKEQTFRKWTATIVDCCNNAAHKSGGRKASVEIEPNIVLTNMLDKAEFNSVDYVVFAGAGDTFEPDALAVMAEVLHRNQGADLLYVDDDRFVDEGCYAMPFFKPDHSIDLLRSFNYIGQMLCLRRELAVDDLICSFGSADVRVNSYNRALRASELSKNSIHVPCVLYHEHSEQANDWVMDEKEACSNRDSNDEHVRAVREHLLRLGLNATVEAAPWRRVQRVRYPVEGRPLVSIIVPNKDNSAMLEECLRSVLDNTLYEHFEIIVVENNSIEECTFDYYAAIQCEDERVRVITWPGEFNFSKIINYGARHARGDYLLLLNNDTKVISPEWLGLMLGVCQRSEVGAVGARLLFSDGSIQHAGALITDKDSGAHHAFMHLPGSCSGYYLQASVTRNCSIVTAACMLTSKAAFDEVGGFAEELTVAYNDVDFCLELRSRGMLVVYEPQAELYHYESVSRGYDSLDLEKRTRLHCEEAYMHWKWANVYMNGDPFFNPNLKSFYFNLNEDRASHAVGR